jgi:hypothetical protein
MLVRKCVIKMFNGYNTVIDQSDEEIVLLHAFGTEKMCGCGWVGLVQSDVSMLPTPLIYSLKKFCMWWSSLFPKNRLPVIDIIWSNMVITIISHRYSDDTLVFEMFVLWFWTASTAVYRLDMTFISFQI